MFVRCRKTADGNNVFGCLAAFCSKQLIGGAVPTLIFPLTALLLLCCICSLQDAILPPCPKPGYGSIYSISLERQLTSILKRGPIGLDVERTELIDTILEILSNAVKQWNDSTLDPPIELVNQQIIDQIVAQKYVVFHHYKTTKRDYGGFYGSH